MTSRKKSGRIIVLLAGSSDGFIPNCLGIVKTSFKTSTSRVEISPLTFSKWFECLLKNLKKPSVIVMDSSRPHCAPSNDTPTVTWKREAILEWFKSKCPDVLIRPGIQKAELLELVDANKPKTTVYAVDKKAEAEGHKVIRLPPYHGHFNAIEHIWVQLKDCVGRNSKDLNAPDIELLVREAVQTITPSDWNVAVCQTRKTAEEAWGKEKILEESVEKLVMTVRESKASASSCDEEYDDVEEEEDSGGEDEQGDGDEDE
ncbi:uncharacterized protein [Anabrus simplex]|uniref:uncharacterized protein n=1 Tax=Anabrus simplex TaxID=316456 RepID=UPI0035A2E6D4